MSLIKTSSSGLYTIAFNRGGVTDLTYLLDAEVPVVNISGFQPNVSTKWWSTNVPLSIEGQYRVCRIRNMSFDLEMSTNDFLGNLNIFAKQGLNLIQSSRSLSFSSIVELSREMSHDHLTKMLLDGGMEARFTLPHPGEVAVYASRRRERLESALENNDLRSRCIEN